MALNCLDKSSEWGSPIFKVLANNDTGSAPGHQGGVVIPEVQNGVQNFPGSWGKESGRDSALLRHLPLRTVRASFPAHGSSLYKGTFRHPISLLFFSIG